MSEEKFITGPEPLSAPEGGPEAQRSSVPQPRTLPWRLWPAGLGGGPWLGVLAMLAVSLALVPGLDEYSMWYDEVQVFRAAESLQGLADLASPAGFPARIVHPPLFFVLLKAWMLLAGQSDLALRALPALLGLLAGALVFRLAADVSAQAAGGLAAAVIFSQMAFARYYIHETHNYSLLLAGAALLLLVYLRWLRRPRPVYAAGVCLATLILAYTHYFSLYLILAVNVHAVLARPRRIRAWAATQLGAALGYAAWVPTLVHVLSGEYQRTEAGGVIATSGATSWALVVWTWEHLLFDGWPYYAAFLALGAAALLALPAGKRGALLRALGPVLIIGAASLALALLGNLAWQAFTARRVIYLLIFVAVALGCTFAYLPRRLRWAILAVFLAATSNTVSQPLPGNWYFRQTVQLVAGRLRPGDALYINFSGDLEAAPFRHYAQRLLPAGTSFALANDPPGHRLNVLLPRQRIWVIWHQDDQAPVAWWDEALRRKGLMEAERLSAAHFRISLFSAPSGRPTPPLAHVNPAGLTLPQTFGDQVALLGSEVDRLSVSPGQALRIRLDWRAVRPVQQDWTVFVHLLAGDFRTLHGQGDGPPTHLGATLSPIFWPVGAPIYDEHTLTVNADTAPGRYFLRIGLYAPGRGERLSVQPGDAVSGPDGLVIAEIQVP